MRRTMSITAAAVACLLLGACGSEGPTVVEEEQPAQIALTVEVLPSAQAKEPATTWEVRCDPGGGDHPRVQAACDTLRKLGLKDAFAPVPKDMQCTMIFGGPQVATVTGHWGDRRVDARFARTNGCEISRWDALVPLLPEV